jgi:glycosyltransferase involved in cell wall biosynthesis
MPDLYQAADIFVLCSLREALGMAIIEAMSCGLPVVCHDFPVMRWVAGNGGVCVDMTESGALLKVLSELCRHRELRDILGWHARSRAIGVFSKQSVIASILELYQDVLLTEKSRSVSFSSKRA